MEQIYYDKTMYHKSRWSRGRTLQRKHVLASITFHDKNGDEYLWTPKYKDLKEIFLYLETLHGEAEVFACILGDGNVEGFKEAIAEFEEESK